MSDEKKSNLLDYNTWSLTAHRFSSSDSYTSWGLKQIGCLLYSISYGSGNSIEQ